VAIAFVAAIGGSAAFATSITTAHTVASGSDRALGGFGITRRNLTTVSTQTFNGDSETAVSGAVSAGGSDGNPCNAKGFALAAPDVATGNLVTTMSDANSASSVHIAMNYTGVDQTTPTTGGVGAAGTSNDVTFTVTPGASGDMIVAMFMSSTSGFHTYVVAGTTVTRINTSQHRLGGEEPATSGSAQAMGWTGNAASDPWRGVAFAFKQAAAAGGGAVRLVGSRFRLAGQGGLAG
jgi:hypothetical protein